MYEYVSGVQLKTSPRVQAPTSPMYKFCMRKVYKKLNIIEESKRTDHYELQVSKQINYTVRASVFACASFHRTLH